MWCVVVLQPSIRRPPLLLADGGASAQLAAHSKEALEVGARLGATGCVSIPWLTVDRQVVLSPNGSVRRRARRITIASVTRAELPELVELGEVMESDVDLGAVVLHVTDERVARAALEVAVSTGSADRLWLRSPLEVVEEWPHDIDRARVVDHVRSADLRGSAEQRATRLRNVGMCGISMPRDDWTGGLIATFHRFGREAWATGARHERMIRELLEMGVDAVASEHPDRLADAVGDLPTRT